MSMQRSRTRKVNVSNPGPRTVILMGRTGNGKSATGNSILGRNAFKSGFSYSLLTTQCELQQTKLKDGRVLNVVDTPGLFDPVVTTDVLVKEIAKCIELAKDGIHAVLLVVSVRNRFTPEEASVLAGLQMLFGPKIVNYIIIIFTGGDVMESDGMTLEEYLNDSPQTLKELLHRCNRRMVIFNNKTKSGSTKENQITELLKQIDSVIAENGQPYSNELFHEAQAMSSKLVGKEHTASQRDCYQEGMNKANIEQQKQLTEMAISEMSLGKKSLWSPKDYHQEEIDHANVQQIGQATQMAMSSKLVGNEHTSSQRDCYQEGMNKANIEQQKQLTEMPISEMSLGKKSLGSPKDYHQEGIDHANVQQIGQSTQMARKYYEEGMDQANVEILRRLYLMVEEKFGSIAEQLANEKCAREDAQQRTDEDMRRLRRDIAKLQSQTPEAMFERFCVIL